MVEVVGFFMVIAVIVYFPYRRVFSGLNRFVNARMVLTGAALIAFPCLWMGAFPDAVDFAAQSSGNEFIDRFINTGAAFAYALCMIMVLAGIVTTGVAIWDARERWKKMLTNKRT